jgi:hypothetical protein
MTMLRLIAPLAALGIVITSDHHHVAMVAGPVVGEAYRKARKKMIQMRVRDEAEMEKGLAEAKKLREAEEARN